MSRKSKNKKFHHNVIKKRMRYLQRQNRRKHRRHISRTVDMYSLNVYEYLREKNFQNIPLKERLGVKSRSNGVVLEMPDVFSMTNNVEQTMMTLKKVFYYGCNDNIKWMKFKHCDCRDLEIAASTIMDTIVVACKTYRRSNGQELTISGDYPTDIKSRRMFVASGLPAHLNLRNKPYFRKDKFKLFTLVAGRTGSGRSGAVATNLTDYINECLDSQEYELTELGQNRISKMFGEVIDNCEIHGGKNATWYVLGHFNMNESNCGEMNIVIFNYGNSIYEQLLSEETTEETKKKITDMKRIHAKQYDGNWNEETMLTVLSIQQGISRLRDQNSEGNKKRGTGTIVLMDTFYMLGNTIEEMNPEFSITSGRTHIVFDNKYRLKEQDDIWGNGKRRTIAFNPSNDLLLKADPSNVQFMKEYFPGTVIAMKFYIDRRHLQNLKGESNGNN